MKSRAAAVGDSTPPPQALEVLTMLQQLVAGPAQQQWVTAVDLQQAGPELIVQLWGAGRRVQQLGPDVALQLMGVALQLLDPNAAVHSFNTTPLI